MTMYARWERTLRAALAATLLIGMPLANAAEIALQNVNYAKSDRKVIVKGRLDAFPGATTLTLRNLATGEILGTTVAKGNQFGFRVNVPLGVRVPCEIEVEARSGSYTAVKTAEVRNVQGICGRYTVALRGLVTDTVIPNATITVTIGGVTYTTVADENGQYTLLIGTTNLDELVKIEAAGTSPLTGEPIEFVNLVGAFSTVLDEQLTAGGSDNNVTNVTTASYVLVLQASGSEPTSEQALQEAETSVDATQLLRLAALIKLIVDDPDYSLPGGETSLLAFVSDPVAVSEYLAAVPQSDLDAAVAQILADSNLVAGFTAGDIPSRYYSIPAARPGYLARQGSLLEFNVSDGSGRLLDYNAVVGQPINAPFNWTVQDDGRLVVNFVSPVSLVYFNTLADSTYFQPLLTDAERARIIAAGSGGQVPVRESVLSYSYTRVADGALVDTASVETRYQTQVESFQLNDGTWFTPSLPPYAQTSQSGQSLRASIDVQALPFAVTCPAAAGSTCVPGKWLASFMYSPGTFRNQPLAEAPYGDVVTFTADGKVTGQLAGLTADWTVDGDGALTITYATGWIQKLQIVDTLGPEFGVFNELSRNDGSRFATYSINVKATGDFVLSNAYLANPAGKFWQGEINSWIAGARWNPDGTRSLFSYFGWQFFEQSSTAANVLGVSLQDCNGDGQLNDPYADLAFSNWQPVGTGIGIPRGNAFSPRVRTWYPAASTVINGERQFYVMEDERFVGGPAAGQLFFPPRINFLREIDAPWTCSN